MLHHIPNTPELLKVAERCVWFKPPEEALSDATHFIAHVLTYGMHQDVSTLRRFITDDQLAEALEHAPPGIFDARSWAYWHVKLGMDEPPPMPYRNLDAVNLEDVHRSKRDVGGLHE